MSANASTDPFQVVSLSLRNKYKGESLWPAAVVGRTDPLMAGMFIPAKRRKKKKWTLVKMVGILEFAAIFVGHR